MFKFNKQNIHYYNSGFKLTRNKTHYLNSRSKHDFKYERPLHTTASVITAFRIPAQTHLVNHVILRKNVPAAWFALR